MSAARTACAARLAAADRAGLKTAEARAAAVQAERSASRALERLVVGLILVLAHAPPAWLGVPLARAVRILEAEIYALLDPATGGFHAEQTSGIPLCHLLPVYQFGASSLMIIAKDEVGGPPHVVSSEWCSVAEVRLAGYSPP